MLYGYLELMASEIDELVPREGIEPTQYCYYQILSLTRLPVPPPRRLRKLYQ